MYISRCLNTVNIHYEKNFKYLFLFVELLSYFTLKSYVSQIFQHNCKLSHSGGRRNTDFSSFAENIFELNLNKSFEICDSYAQINLY